METIENKSGTASKKDNGRSSQGRLGTDPLAETKIANRN
jgi:hypothetical protein